MTLILNKSDVASVLSMKDCMDTMESAFSELANGTAVLPLRTAIAPPDGLSLYMPAYLKNMQALAIKVVTVYKNNPLKYNLPTTIGKVLLQDPLTGDVVCIMNGGYLTAVRTGAASGIATTDKHPKLAHQVARPRMARAFGNIWNRAQRPKKSSVKTPDEADMKRDHNAKVSDFNQAIRSFRQIDKVAGK